MHIQRVVGANVRRFRRQAGMSQEELAGRLEAKAQGKSVDQAYISRLEGGRWNVTIVTLWQLAGILGISLSDLVREDDTVKDES